MTDVSPLIDAMGLAPHPEGGHYRRTWTAPARVDTPRGALEVHLGGSGDAPDADPRIVTLGSPASTQASDASNPLQILVPTGTWQRTFARGDYALATCVVSPEFTFEDWKLAEGV